MALLGKRTIPRKGTIEVCLGNVIELFSGHERPVEWNIFLHSRHGLFHYRKTEACPAVVITVVEHIALAVVVKNEGVFDHFGIPAGC